MADIQTQIRDALLGGDDLSDLVAKFDDYPKDTLNRYLCKIRKNFTPEQNAQAIQARSIRPRKISYCQPSISTEHRRVGMKLSGFMAENHLSPAEFQNKYGLGTPTKISKMRNGIHEFTLSELIKIAKILNFSLIEIVEPFKVEDNGSD